MKKAFWFSRHMPTESQAAELAMQGYDLIANNASQTLGGTNLETDGDVKAVVTGILAQCQELNADLVVGVFPAPIAEVAMRTAEDAIADGDYRSGAIACWAAWNVMRSVDGGKPTFEHQRFCRVGILHSDALRWS